jgi:hypothetical protein
MIPGGFDLKGRPLIRVDVSSRFFQGPGVVNFLVDAGAFNTIIMPGDAVKFGVDFAQFLSVKQSRLEAAQS